MSTNWESATTRIFVSYSHSDLEHVQGEKSLLGYLRGLEMNGAAFWSDRELPAGHWDKTIRERLAEADIALVLVSQQLLNSDYVRSVELQLMLERMRKHGLKIMPVLLSPSDWEAHGWLKRLQHKPDGDTTLATSDGPGARDGLYLEILQWLRAELNQPPAEKAIEAMAGAVNVINSLEPEYRALLDPNWAPGSHSLHFEGFGNEVRITRNTVLENTITAADLSHLTLDQVNDIAVMQRDMRGYYETWFALYRRRNEPGVADELRQLASTFKPRLLTLIERLEDYGLDIEDHYRYFYDFLNRLAGA